MAGPGYNSGIRDAANLGWKLAAVVNGQAGDGLLDTYDVERRKHARAMIDLSTMVGRVISPTNRRVAALRDRMIRGASVVPTLKRYVLEMRFKPMPRYEHGAVHHPKPPTAASPVGTLFIQPRVDTREHSDVLLDDVVGPGFAVLCWNNDPRSLLGAEAFERWKALGAVFIAARPQTQLHWTGRMPLKIRPWSSSATAPVPSNPGSTSTPSRFWCCARTAALPEPTSRNARRN